MSTPCCVSSLGSYTCYYQPCPPLASYPSLHCEPYCPPPKPKPSSPGISFVSYPVCPTPTCPVPKLDTCPSNRMVCFATCHPPTNGPFKTSNGIQLEPCKSYELIGSEFLLGCDCGKHNGLQDNCRRTECRGTALCRARQWACCRPSKFSGGKHQEAKFRRRDVEEC